MKIIQQADYRIYFDDVRMDPYIKSWTAQCGLNASDAQASITMYRTKALEQWKAYLTQVRIYVRNVFSNKFSIVFEGEITDRNWTEQRNDVGTISYTCQGFYHWLDISIPLMIGSEDALDQITRFKYQAMDINVDAVTKLFESNAQLMQNSQPIRNIIDNLFTAIYAGYYSLSDSSFQWADLKNRFKVMADIITEFRNSGFLDAFTFTRTTMIQSFYVYLSDILTQLMFEFFQDRDGAIRIKNPSWGDNILKAFILDESVVYNANGYNNWGNEPTRVLAVGGKTDVARAGDSAALSTGSVMGVPMGLYIGDPNGKNQYYTQDIGVQMQQFGTAANLSGVQSAGLAALFSQCQQWEGKANVMKYHWGGGRQSTWDAFVSGGVADCSSFTMQMYKHFLNINIPSTSQLQQADKSSSSVDKNSLLPGDLVFFCDNGTGKATHVGIYYQNDQFYNMTSEGKPLTLSSLSSSWEKQYFVGAKRYPNVAASSSTTASSSASGPSGSSDETSYINMDLKNQTNMNASQIDAWIKKNTKSKSLFWGKGSTFVQAAAQSGLDPMYIVAHAALESGWGTSNIANAKYNFFGIGAVDSNPTNGAYTFDSVDNGIINGAKWIRAKYYDVGQTSLYTMRHSPSGTHNYCTDSLWPNKIALIMMNSGEPAGVKASSATALVPGQGESGGTSNYQQQQINKYLGTPYAGSGGYTFTTTVTGTPDPNQTNNYANTSLSTNALGQPVVSEAAPKAVDPTTFTNNILKYPVPASASSYQSYITSKPNGINPNIICEVIEAASGWKEKYNSGNRMGLMGVPLAYAQATGLDPSKLLEPQMNIQEGTALLAAGMSTFNGKLTFALAALYLGDLQPVEKVTQDINAVDFTKARANLPSDCVAFVDNIVDKFCTIFGGNYLVNDPNKLFSGFGGKIKVDYATNTAVPDYTSSYKPVLTDEERLFKINLQITEQLLIKYDLSSNNAVPSSGMTPDELIRRYAEYMMQLFRAESHGITVQLSTSLPFLRPGFNCWLEPTRRDLVFYITGVQHQGSYQQGTQTTVNGGFIRDPATYNQVASNVFVSSSNSSASDFGDVISTSDMSGIRTQLDNLHQTSDEVIGDARSVPYLSQMYSSAVGKSNAYTTSWSGEFTASELDAAIATLYKNPPNVVVTRKNSLKQIIDDGASFFTSMLLYTPFS